MGKMQECCWWITQQYTYNEKVFYHGNFTWKLRFSSSFTSLLINSSVCETYSEDNCHKTPHYFLQNRKTNAGKKMSNVILQRYLKSFPLVSTLRVHQLNRNLDKVNK